MTVNDLITNVNTFIGDSSNDRISATDRYQALTEATAWLLEELGNEHMVDRAEIEYLPTVTWYKMDNLTPYLLTAGQLRFKEREDDDLDFTRIDARDLATNNANRNMYAIERFNADSYVGITLEKSNRLQYTDLIQLNKNDGLTYTGVNAENITPEKDAIAFDMDATSITSFGITTETEAKDISFYERDGSIICEFEIPDLEDVTSVSIRFGSDLTTDYFLGVVNQDVNGNTLTTGVNTVKFRMRDLTEVGTPDLEDITKWGFYINCDSTKPQTGDYKVSDLRVAIPVYLDFKYIFYRVGKNTSGVDITEYSATTDVPFFSERYPQYKFAVAHKAAGVLFRGLQLLENARSEDSEANKALGRYRKNFNTERDMGSSQFRPAGINLRGRRVIRRR